MHKYLNGIVSSSLDKYAMLISSLDLGWVLTNTTMQKHIFWITHILNIKLYLIVDTHSKINYFRYK